MPIPMVGVSVPKPRAINMTPLSNLANITNLAPPVGQSDPGPDWIGELGKRITSDIASARSNANVDVTGLLSRLKAQQGNWKPNVALPASRITIRPGSAPTGGAVKLTGGTDQWIAQAYKILGIPLTPTALAHERYLIQHESGGNPNAVNRWDSNAKKGTPSIGLEQVIGPTFARYMLPGHANIRNPIDNILASLRYRKATKGAYDIGFYKGGY